MSDPSDHSVHHRTSLMDPRLRDFLDTQYPTWKKIALNRLHGSLSADADDVVQAVAEKIVRKWSTISALSDQALRPFTLKMLGDQIATAQRVGIRDEMRRTGKEPGEDLPQPDTGDTETEAQLRLLAWAMEQLRAAYPQWADVVGYRQSGTSYEDIAALTSVAVSTAKNHYSMGVRYLQRQVDAALGDSGGPKGEV